jgi:hypothetical protein
MLAATAILLALAAPGPDFRTLTVDVSLTHTDEWQTDAAAGRQSLHFATPHPVRQSIVVYRAAGAPPFQTMTNDELTFSPPRARVERSGCATTRPRVRTRFSVEDDFLFTVGGVPRRATPCPPAEAELAFALPEPVEFEGGARRIKRLKRGGRVTLRASVQHGACGERPASGPWECATTTATVKVRRVS